jgi:hypothetical protein
MYICISCIYIYVYNVYIYVGIMDLHNGQITVASEGEGKGCAFTVKIPMLRYSSLIVPTGRISAPSISLPRPSFLHLSDSKMLMTPCDIETSAPVLVDKTSKCPSLEVEKTKTLPPLEVLVVDDSNLNR